MGVTKKRTFVKTAIYRVWILITSYIFLSIVGKSWSDSILPTLTLNFLYSIGYYTYDRIWQNIKWGIRKSLMNWITLSLSMIITLVVFYIFAKAVKLFGIELL